MHRFRLPVNAVVFMSICAIGTAARSQAIVPCGSAPLNGGTLSSAGDKLSYGFAANDHGQVAGEVPGTAPDGLPAYVPTTWTRPPAGGCFSARPLGALGGHA